MERGDAWEGQERKEDDRGEGDEGEDLVRGFVVFGLFYVLGASKVSIVKSGTYAIELRGRRYTQRIRNE
jgi:hypothetical protein